MKTLRWTASTIHPTRAFYRHYYVSVQICSAIRITIMINNYHQCFQALWWLL